MQQALLLSLLAGAMIPLGAWIAWRRDQFDERVPHAVVAFGGGTLVSAVALVLVPDGAARIPDALAVVLFLAGGAVFRWIDASVKRISGQHGQMLAMLTDFIPEAAALGALLATGENSAFLLAALIGLQNLPEGFNAWRENPPNAPRRTMALYCALALLGPAAAMAGNVFLSQSDGALGGLMVFAAGGVLYLVFEDVAPADRMESDPTPPLGAVAGFALGLAGHLMLT
ncbi:zinc transporter, ZIP family [Jannaschia faecimaris]|uniref:Zinc transporter, ZIP family n=1 Tax=Jannaschia faecimaris TaxID=1244108 RepID=A0A1H3TMC3_9RHOB|nr:hypothetical protein [Jannaschia faecimaris]SDZ51376.1 zinc transporter, ZIP family [Jannaschia faecimaris]